MNDYSPTGAQSHSINLVCREKLDIDGVVDVLDFDNSCVNIKTTMGILSVEGAGLRIVSLSNDTGKIYIEGAVDSLYYYTIAEEKKGGIFKRLVK